MYFLHTLVFEIWAISDWVGDCSWTMLF